MPVKIFVGNLTEATESSSIRNLFEQYGEVVECDALGRFGFVHMKNEEDALSAIEGLNGTMVDGRKMNVELSTAKRGGRGGGRGGGFGGRGRGDYGGGRGGRGGDRGRSDRGGRGRGRGRFDPYSRGYEEDEDYYGEESYPRRRPRLPPELLDRLEARLAAALMAPYADPYASREPYASRDPYAAAGRDLLSRYRDPYAERGADPYSRPPPEYYADRGERDTGTTSSTLDSLYTDFETGRAERSAATAVGYPDPASYGYGGRAGDAAKKRSGFGSSAGSGSGFGFGSGAGESSVASLTADATSSWSSWASGGGESNGASSALPAKSAYSGSRGGGSRGRGRGAISYY